MTSLDASPKRYLLTRGETEVSLCLLQVSEQGAMAGCGTVLDHKHGANSGGAGGKGASSQQTASGKQRTAEIVVRRQ